MGTVTDIARVKFSVGDVIHHRLFHYRGVVVDVDKNFQGSQAWYQAVARSRPPKNRPWYHVLVHDSDNATYVAEQNLELDNTQQPVDHPMLEHFFCRYENGRYIRLDPVN